MTTIWIRSAARPSDAEARNQAPSAGLRCGEGRPPFARRLAGRRSRSALRLPRQPSAERHPRATHRCYRQQRPLEMPGLRLGTPSRVRPAPDLAEVLGQASPGHSPRTRAAAGTRRSKTRLTTPSVSTNKDRRPGDKYDGARDRNGVPPSLDRRTRTFWIRRDAMCQSGTTRMQKTARYAPTAVANCHVPNASGWRRCATKITSPMPNGPTTSRATPSHPAMASTPRTPTVGVPPPMGFTLQRGRTPG